LAKNNARKRGTQGGGVQSIAGMNQLQQRILFTLAFIGLYRVGVHIPIPGVDGDALATFFQQQGANLFGTLNMFTGGALERFSVVALGVMPYISASIIFQLLTVAVPHLEQLRKEGQTGQQKINQYTRYATMGLAIVQGFFISRSLSGQVFAGKALVMDPGFGWILLSTLSLTAGTAFVMWLGEKITDHGVGNGISLIIMAGIIASLPSVLANTYQQHTMSEIDTSTILFILFVIVLITAGVVFMEQASRRIPVEYARRQVGNKVYQGQNTYLPLRINAAGVIPPIFASSLLQFPSTFVSFAPQGGWADVLRDTLAPTGYVFNLIYAVLVIFFTFFYVSITFKPDDIAENLKKNGGFIPGIRPGARTSEFLQKISDRLTCIGSVYLAFICVFPVFLTARFNIPFAFGGTSLLIVVGVALDTFRQLEAHRQSLRYDTFLKKGTVKTRSTMA